MHYLRRKGPAVARPFLAKPWISIPKPRRRPTGTGTRSRVGMPAVRSAFRQRAGAQAGAERGSIMKVRNSLRSLKRKPGSVITRRRGRMVVINRKNPRWNGRQG
jgi:large subunit ribosomal protein L36